MRLGAYLRVAVSALAMASLAACQGQQPNLPDLLQTIFDPNSGRPTSVVPRTASSPNQQTGQQPGQTPGQANTPPGTLPGAQAQQPVTAAPRPGVEARPLETPQAAIPAPPAMPGPVLTPPGSSETVRIGFLVPLSGPNAPIGRALLDAAQMALFDLADDRLQLLPRDTEGMPEKSAESARALLAEGADILIGPLFAGDTSAVAPLARARGVKVISFSSDRSVAGQGVYIFGITPGQQVARVVNFARAKGLTRFALLAPESPYGDAVAQAMAQTLNAAAMQAQTSFAAQQASAPVAQPAAGSASETPAAPRPPALPRLLRQDRYPADAPDLTPTVRRFVNALRLLPPPLEGEATDRPVDAVMLPEGGARLRALAPLLPYLDIDPRVVRFLGTGLWDDPGLGSEPALIGGWFAAPPPEGFEEFRARFEKTFGRRPPRLASLGYDAAALAGILAKRPRIDGRAFYDETVLNADDGFAGYDGIFRFRPDGVVERGLSVLEVQRRGPRVVDPAPANFQVTAN